MDLLIDGSVVSTVDPGNIAGAGTITPVTVFYIALPSDVGKTLSFRISSDRNVGGSSDVGIDNWQLEVGAAPEPSTLGLMGIGALLLGRMRRQIRLNSHA